MLVTFNNLFSLEEKPYKTPRIHYKHAFRVELKVYVDYNPQSEKENAHDRDWQINIEGDKKVIEKFMAQISREISQYLKQRTKKSFTAIRFKEIVALAKMRSIH